MALPIFEVFAVIWALRFASTMNRIILPEADRAKIKADLARARKERPGFRPTLREAVQAALQIVESTDRFAWENPAEAVADTILFGVAFRNIARGVGISKKLASLLVARIGVSLPRSAASLFRALNSFSKGDVARGVKELAKFAEAVGKDFGAMADHIGRASVAGLRIIDKLGKVAADPIEALRKAPELFESIQADLAVIYENALGFFGLAEPLVQIAVPTIEPGRERRERLPKPSHGDIRGAWEVILAEAGPRVERRPEPGVRTFRGPGVPTRTFPTPGVTRTAMGQLGFGRRILLDIDIKAIEAEARRRGGISQRSVVGATDLQAILEELKGG